MGNAGRTIWKVACLDFTLDGKSLTAIFESVAVLMKHTAYTNSIKEREAYTHLTRTTVSVQNVNVLIISDKKINGKYHTDQPPLCMTTLCSRVSPQH